ncbi:hypothetical protein EJ08DRAFT_214966 [Tothia fuscella]|uniref:Uncharacterized protein n=1 Tax=Tothia fuscella TaxID=1048955 RepID=A0A9P4TYT8_9PEZI|nr:hypothetical protein EJ08DRAFT_214966 [Tothia fuscella]
MKFQLAITTFLSALPLFTQALAHPAIGNSLAIKRSEIVAGQPASFDLEKRGSVDLLNKRQNDDEWLVVMYDNGSGDQCGGVSGDVVGKKDGLCKEFSNLAGKICADVKVGVNIGVAKCDVSFKSGGCGGTEENHVTVYAGQDSNGVPLTDQVRFVSVTCSE